MGQWYLRVLAPGVVAALIVEPFVHEAAMHIEPPDFRPPPATAQAIGAFVSGTPASVISADGFTRLGDYNVLWHR